MKVKHINISSATRWPSVIHFIVDKLHNASWYRTDREPLYQDEFDYDFFINPKTGRISEITTWESTKLYTLVIGKWHLHAFKYLNN